ncbi:hypothetical protein H6F77_16400 [Microcoleus sp. FACHB-831]|uniref:hypothetical protein n=1 Tax=Microcoleus sp. FACHB-831 TaxID=2692827 RepID=UPI001681FC06|nr:hypothetical protein [Microcoleus sp. FACHB-831]MBD1922644.1 hypothetical protein [Microcoleus sp. FACHB-831]
MVVRCEYAFILAYSLGGAIAKIYGIYAFPPLAKKPGLGGSPPNPPVGGRVRPPNPLHMKFTPVG